MNRILKNSFVILIVFIIPIASCNFKKQNDIKLLENQLHELKNSKITIPNSLVLIKNESSYSENQININYPEMKIVTYINGDCGSCINNIHKWDKFLKQINHLRKIQFIPIVYSSDILYFKETMLSLFNNNQTLYIDTCNIYLKENKLIQKDKVFWSFLLDSNNQIILTGNPIYSEKLMKLYKEEINKRLN